MSKIFIVGSINMDLVANVPYMPKAGETISSDFFSNLGGKGANQAVACSKLGGEVTMIGAVGSDDYGKTILSSLASYNVRTENISVKDSMSGIALIIVAKGNNRIILGAGANGLLTTADVELGLASAEAGDILLTQLEIPLDVVEFALKLARSKGMITSLNPAPAVKHLSDGILSNIDIITPNETETEILTGIPPIDDVHIALAVKKFYSYGIKNVIITLGKRGAVVSSGQHITPIDAIPVKVVDTTSAGDTFIGGTAVQLASGANIVDSCTFGNYAASITIGRKGASVSIPTQSEVINRYYQDLPLSNFIKN